MTSMGDPYEIPKLIADAGTAVGTLAVAVMAVWGDWVRSKFFSPKLEVRLVDSKGDFNHITPTMQKVRFFHLVISNKRRTLATNCRVMLRDIQKKAPNGQLQPLPTVYPLQLIWTPAEMGIYAQNISKDAVVDLGHVAEGADRFQLSILVRPNNFRGDVFPGETARYGIGIDADNFSSKDLHYFDVSWDGKWSDDSDQMRLHLSVDPIPSN
jgi:hypothetical protein